MIITKHFLEFTLDRTDIAIAIVVFAAIWIAIGLTAVNVFKDQPRRLSWAISLVNSFVLTVTGIVYLIVKVPTFDKFLFFGDNGREVFHSLDNVSVLISIWFTLANISDLVFGLLFYRKFLDPLTAYVHHTVYIWILVTGMTGHGGFAHFEPFCAGPVYMFVEELPTFLLALGSVFPACRTDLGFGATFLLLRLVYHGYMLLYSVHLGANLVVPVMFTLTMALHVFWYYVWCTKYGWKLIWADDNKAKKVKPVDKLT